MLNHTDILSSSTDQISLVEQVKRVKEIEAIESDSFIPQVFRSSKEVKKVSFQSPDFAYCPLWISAKQVYSWNLHLHYLFI